jgi:hypothetical protein
LSNTRPQQQIVRGSNQLSDTRSRQQIVGGLNQPALVPNNKNNLPLQLEGMNVLEICNWLVDRPQIIELASKMLVAKTSPHDEINLDLSYNSNKKSITSSEVSVNFSFSKFLLRINNKLFI